MSRRASAASLMRRDALGIAPTPRWFRRDKTSIAQRDEQDAGWGWLLVLPLVLCVALLASSQGLFIDGSLHRDLGLGRVATDYELTNYRRVLSDPFYLECLWLTVKLSGLATAGTVLLAFPVAYVIARMRSRWGMVMLAAIVASTFVTIVIKVFGLIIIFAGNGWLNRGLMKLGIVAQPVQILGTQSGVVVGLMQFTIGFCVLVLYSVIQTIPRSYEEAARAHGAGSFRTFWRVLLPLSLPGLLVGTLTTFNLCMGAFTSAALIGGGKVLTLPVMIQRTILTEVKYSMAATLAVVLLASVLLVNLLSVCTIRRMRIGRRLIA
jgi:putative spermidine/putrescine transport system permease protein